MRQFVVVFFIALTARAEPPADVRAVLSKSCVGCHRGDAPPAGIDLEKLDFNLDHPHTFSVWVRVHDAVKEGVMPPAGTPLPSRQSFAAGIAGHLLAHERSRVATQGRAVLRRLNRYEYETTLRELLGAPWLQVRDGLPEDGMVGRFNKSGQALDISHVQMARYVETGEEAIRQTLAAAAEPETTRRYYAREQQRFLNRMRYSSFNRHPERATIPILGFAAQPDVLAEKVPITVGSADPQTRELEGFATPAGNYVGNEHHFDQFSAPVGGQYKLRLNAFSLWIHTIHTALTRGDKLAYWRPDREKTSRGRTTEPVTLYAFGKGGEKRLLGSVDVTPEPAVHEMTVWLQPGDRILPDAARLFRSRPGFIGSPHASEEGLPGVAYRWLEVTGPGRPAGPAVRVNFSDGDPERLLRDFLERAYRRTPTEAEVRRYAGIFQQQLAAKPDFREAMIAAYTAVLCSPGFLYLEEAPGRLAPGALAARLSYFLWNAPPDARLRELAAGGRLTQPDVLRRETERLLDDPRSSQFIEAFLDYWLDLRRAGETTPDQTLYPEYYLDDLLIESAVKETQLFFAELLRGDLPARTLADSRFAIVNSHLARHYGLPAVEGVAMRKVELPEDSVRGGLLTQASILKVTANGTTTSPVLRGVWILERILGDPVPPPPSGTPAIEPDTRGATTIREQLDKHRSSPACAGCHQKIDPPGFALESFDVLGGWRDRYRSTEEGEPAKGIGKNGHVFVFRYAQPADGSGRTADGRAFRDVREFKKLLAGSERQLARNLVQQFVAYGTGAPVSFGDRAEVERILDRTAAGGYGVRSLIQEVVSSSLFRNK